MTTDRKAVSRAVLGLWAPDGDVDPGAVLTADYRNHQEPDAEGGASTKSLAEYRALVAAHHQSFDPLEVDVLLQVEEGDLVATRWRFTGTHSGDHLGVAPTGPRLSWTGIQIDRFEGDVVVESWVDWDKYRLLEGLGLVASD